jgi:two-component system, OmpR family, osmolarity sensor histidine kinase EnvZ
MIALPTRHWSIRTLRQLARQIWRSAWTVLPNMMPKGLYARALIIIIAPIVLLESVVAFVFMERHWQEETIRLSAATSGSIGSVIDAFDASKNKDDYRKLIDLASRRFEMALSIMPAGELPPPKPNPVVFDLLNRILTQELANQIDKPYWIDTRDDRDVEVRVKLPKAILRMIVPRSRTYATNSHIFLVWMIGTSLVLLTVAIMFLRNQIRPIVKLAEAAEAFGKGRPMPTDFRARGAREIRLAASAFEEMRDRIEKHVEQRTTMLAGVSHDLRTVLTRFKLQLAMLEGAPGTDAMRDDVDEMQAMLEDYMAFAKGGSGEEAKPTDVRAMMEEVRAGALHFGKPIELRFRRRRKIPVPLRRHGFKRAISNLVSNAARYANTIVVTVTQDRHWLRIEVDDDGPGIPLEKREIVFRPFLRLDPGRNQDLPNTGLGLAIARDIARVHGGDIWLEESELGGLKGVVRVPV